MQYVRIARQDTANGFPLHADAAPVNNAQRVKSEQLHLLQPRFHHPADIAWRNGVQIENIGNGDANGLVVHAFEQ